MRDAGRRVGGAGGHLESGWVRAGGNAVLGLWVQYYFRLLLAALWPMRAHQRRRAQRRCLLRVKSDKGAWAHLGPTLIGPET